MFKARSTFWLWRAKFTMKGIKMKRHYLASVCFGFGVLATNVFAGEAEIKASLEASLPRVQIQSVAPTAVKDIYQVVLSSGQVLHTTADGKHFFAGDLISLEGNKIANVTEEWRAKNRVEALHSLKDKDLVVFPAKGAEKGELYVFTDVTCGYCIKFHSEVPELNRQGITVKYAAWPRAGVSSDAGNTMRDVWCAADRQTAMTNAKSHKAVEHAKDSCTDQVIADQVKLGFALGVNGTPAVFDKNGQKLGGYAPADVFVKALTQR
ncbi:probable thiol:disulfide interchange protein [gamma proteobacterium HdN1]|nr:probable thiol:disulfide interchange protein [gamma proteobacterium HdN1]